MTNHVIFCWSGKNFRDCILKNEHIISELKEKVVLLNSGIRQLEMQVKDLGNQNMQVKIFLVFSSHAN